MGQRIAGRVERPRALGAAVGGDDHAVRDEDARDQDCLRQQPAAVAAQVEHQPLGPLRVEPLDLLAELAVRAGKESDETHVPELLAADLLDPAGHLRDIDLAPGHGHVAALPLAALDRQRHLGPGRAANLVGDGVGILAGDGLAVHSGDHFARLDPGFPSGRVLVDRGDPQALIHLRHRDSDTR
jgi:hypothetical protein